MIDIHTHILPGIDDGSSNAEESIAMLGMLMNQGVDTVVATPHFYIDEINAEDFLEKRNKAAEELYRALDGIENRPRIALGAEVEFYNDLASHELLESLCISGTKYILVEMPFTRWTDYTYQALANISRNRGITPIVAHLDRYLDMQKSNVVDMLVEADALIQINSSFIIEKSTRRKALGMIKKGMVCYLGSDCHNMTVRRPDIGEAVDILCSKSMYEELDSLAYWENVLTRTAKTF